MASAVETSSSPNGLYQSIDASSSVSRQPQVEGRAHGLTVVNLTNEVNQWVNTLKEHNKTYVAHNSVHYKKIAKALVPAIAISLVWITLLVLLITNFSFGFYFTFLGASIVCLPTAFCLFVAARNIYTENKSNLIQNKDILANVKACIGALTARKNQVLEDLPLVKMLKKITRDAEITENLKAEEILRVFSLCQKVYQVPSYKPVTDLEKEHSKILSDLQQRQSVVNGEREMLRQQELEIQQLRQRFV